MPTRLAGESWRAGITLPTRRRVVFWPGGGLSADVSVFMYLEKKMTLLDQTLEMKRSQAAEAKATARAAGLAKVARLAELMMKTEPDTGEMEELSRLMDDFDLSHEAAYEDAERFREIAEAEESIERRTKELDQIPSEQKLRADHKALDEKIEKAIAKLREPLAELEKEIERRRNIEHILDGEALRRNVYAQNLSPRVRDAFYGYGT